MSINTTIIGITGAGRKTGCTHLCLILANFLKNKNYKVALLEKNATHVFRDIMDAEEIPESIDGGFYLNELDFYVTKNETTLPLIISRPYNYLIIDYGDYITCDKALFSTNAIKIITCGSKPWEFGGINAIFSHTSEEILKSFNYCFSFARNNFALQKEIIQGMDELKKIYFPPYTENPFSDDDFPEASIILELSEEPIESVKKKRITLGMKRKNKLVSIKEPLEPFEPELPITMKISEPPQVEEVSSIKEADLEQTQENIQENAQESPQSRKRTKMNFLSKFTSGKKEPELKIDFDLEEDADVSFNIGGINKKIMPVLSSICRIKELTQDQESEFVNKLITDSYNDAFCIALRSGSLVIRKNGKNEEAIISILLEQNEIVIEEEIVKKIVGEKSFNKIITPYEDSYRKVTV